MVYVVVKNVLFLFSNRGQLSSRGCQHFLSQLTNRGGQKAKLQDEEAIEKVLRGVICTAMIGCRHNNTVAVVGHQFLGAAAICLTLSRDAQSLLH